MSKKKQKPSVPNSTSRPAATRSRPIAPTSSGSGQTPSRPVDKPATPPLTCHPIQPWWALLIAAVGFSLYINTFSNDLALDDFAAIRQNLFVKDGINGIPGLLRTEFWHFSNISLGYYRPLSLITFALEKEYFGNDPFISHLINASLYAITGFMLTILLQKWLPNRIVLTTLIALLFIAHPIHTEIVANIKGRDELLSFLFLCSMLFCYWRYLETDRKWLIALAVFFLYAAFMSKESSIVGLGLLPIMQYYIAQRSITQSLRSLWPFLLVTALFFYQKKAMIGTLSGKLPIDWANYPYALGKTKLATTFKFITYYIRLLFFPHPLVYDYSYNVIPPGGVSDIMTWIGVLAAIGLIWLAWKGFRKRTFWGFGIAWWFVTMAPAIGFIAGRGGILAERFLYAPVLGFATVILIGLNTLISRQLNLPETAPAAKRYGILIAISLITTILYSVKTIDRNKDWKNNFVLFTTDEKQASESCQVNRHVANEWIEKCSKEKNPKKKKEYFDLAISHLKKSTQIYPNFGEAVFSIGYAYHSLLPNRDSAIYYYRRAIKISSAYAPAYNNLGVIYQNAQRYHLASYLYNLSMKANPAYVDARTNWQNLKNRVGLDVKILPDSLLNEAVLPINPKPAPIQVRLPLLHP